MYRVEDKYVLPDSRLYLLERRIAMLLPMDGLGGKEGYKISSLYFDDITDSMLADTLDGNPFREKYRIRIYNDSLSPVRLEVKRKKYNRAVKISSEITEEELSALMSGRTISDRNHPSDARTLFNLAIKARGLRPKIIVAYDRRAYVHEAGNVRITFDRKLRASSQWELFGKNGIRYDFPEDAGAVLEVKYDEWIPRYLMQVLETGNMIQASHSKYGICREIYESRRNRPCRLRM